MTKQALRVTGKAKLREGELGNCSHCGREIRRVVFLSDGSAVGERCAVRLLGFARSAVDAAPDAVGSVREAVERRARYAVVGGRVVEVSYRMGDEPGVVAAVVWAPC